MMSGKELIEIQIAHLQGQIEEKRKKLEELEKEPEMLLMRQGKVDVVDYNKTTYYRIEYTGTFVGVFKWYERQKDFSNLMPILSGGEVLEEYYQKEVIKQKQEYPYKVDETQKKSVYNITDLNREKNDPKTLYGILQEWWNDILSKNSDLDFDISVDYLVDLIDTKFIPPSSKFNSYELEKCLKMMRDNLRDK